MSGGPLPPGIEEGESFIDTICGEKIVFTSAEADPDGCEYIRFVDERGVETAYWDSNEWRDDPIGVMGAIMGAMMRGAKD